MSDWPCSPNVGVIVTVEAGLMVRDAEFTLENGTLVDVAPEIETR